MASKPEAKPEEGAAAKTAGGGGLKPWLPLIANLVLMPVMGYLTVNFFLVPKSAHPAAAEAKAESKEKSGGKSEGGEKGEGAGKGERILVALKDKVIVNVQNTQMSRYLLARITLEGTTANFKELVERNDDELRDAAGSVLQNKTIADLDKPGAKNLIRAELMSVFSNILGQGAIKQVLLTEFAVQ